MKQKHDAGTGVGVGLVDDVAGALQDAQGGIGLDGVVVVDVAELVYLEGTGKSLAALYAYLEVIGKLSAMRFFSFTLSLVS